MAPIGMSTHAPNGFQISICAISPPFTEGSDNNGDMVKCSEVCWRECQVPSVAVAGTAAADELMPGTETDLSETCDGWA